MFRVLKKKEKKSLLCSEFYKCFLMLCFSLPIPIHRLDPKDLWNISINSIN